MVTSRLTSDCQSLAAPTTSIAAPVVSEARNVMMATTTASERPAIESFGTIGAVPASLRTTVGGVSSSSQGSVMASTGSVVDMQATFMQDQPAGVVLVHEGDVVGRDDDRSAGFVKLDEEPQQSLPETGVDVAGWLVGEQKLRACDHGAGDGGALFFPAGKDRRQGAHAIPQPNPLQQFDDFGAIVRLLLTQDPERQRHIFVGREVVEQAEILKHDTDPAAQIGAPILAERGGILIEHVDQDAARPQRQQHQTEQGGLARTGGAGQKMEGMPVDRKMGVAQRLGPEPIAQADILEPDPPPSSASLQVINEGRGRFAASHNPLSMVPVPAGMVSNPLTDRR